MYDNVETLKKISGEISGLKVTFDTCQSSKLKHKTKKTIYINLNLEQLDNIPIYQRKKRKHNVRYFYFMVLLHEIGHYKKLCKFKSVLRYENWRDNNNNYNEKLADRYATKYYKKYTN